MAPIADYLHVRAFVVLLGWKVTGKLQVVDVNLDIWRIYVLALWYRSEMGLYGTILKVNIKCTVEQTLQHLIVPFFWDTLYV